MNDSPLTPAGALQRFFNAPLAETDPELAAAIGRELARQQDGIELIASENMVSRAVLEAQGSVLTNKYAEGYSGRRYYGGCAEVDVAETLAIERAKQLFSCGFANVQPHSGAQANQAVFLALLNPGDTILGMSLAAGGHLTHGAAPNLSGKWFRAIQYGVRREDGLLDYDEIARLAEAEKPKLIIAGGSAYPRVIDFARMRAIADRVGAGFMVDMAHFAGLVAAGLFPSPLPHAHVVTTTTHKTLRGPRGGMVLTNDADIAKKINSAVFPGLQGGPLMHVIAAKAVAFGEALRPEFRAYQQAVAANAKALADLPESKRNDTAWLRMAEVDSIKVFAEKVDKALNGKARASDGKESSVKLTLGMPASRKKAVEGGLNRIAKDMGIEDPGKALEVIVAEHNGSAGLIAAITKAVQKVKAAKRIIHGDLSADEQIAQVEKLMDEMVLDFKAALDQATHGDAAD